MKKMIIALALVICQLIVPISAAAEPAQAPTKEINVNSCSFVEMLAIMGMAYQGGWYEGQTRAQTNDSVVEEAFYDAAEIVSDMPAAIAAAHGYSVMREYCYYMGTDIVSMVGRTYNYNEVCFNTYMGYIAGFSFGYDMNIGDGDTSESFDWALDDIKEHGEAKCREGGQVLLSYLSETGMMPVHEQSDYYDLCFIAGCAHNVGWSIGYDKADDSDYTNEDLLASVLWAADYVDDSDESDIVDEGQYSFESIYKLMGNSVAGFENDTYVLNDVFFAAGVAGVDGLYEQLHGDDGSQAASELNSLSTEAIINLGLDYVSQFMLAYLEGRIVYNG